MTILSIHIALWHLKKDPVDFKCVQQALNTFSFPSAHFRFIEFDVHVEVYYPGNSFLRHVERSKKNVRLTRILRLSNWWRALIFNTQLVGSCSHFFYCHAAGRDLKASLPPQARGLHGVQPPAIPTLDSPGVLFCKRPFVGIRMLSWFSGVCPLFFFCCLSFHSLQFLSSDWLWLEKPQG